MRKKTRITTIITIVLVAAAIAIVWAMNRPTPGGEAGQPTPTATTAEPTAEPTEAEPGEEDPTEVDPETPGLSESWSTALAPSCGDVLTEADLDSLIEFADPPSEISARDPFPVQVRNSTADDLLTEVDRYDFAVPVLTNAAGEVVAVAEMTPTLAEGYSVLALAGGAELTVSGTLRWALVCGEEVADHEEPAPVAEGDYQLFLLATTGPFDDPRAANQIHGGPFAVTVTDSAEHDVPHTHLAGFATPACGQPWQVTPTDTGVSFTLDEAASGADPEQVLLSGDVAIAQETTAANIYAQVLILADGMVVGPTPHASDNLIGWYASAGLAAPIEAVTRAVDCDGEGLPVGEYEAVLVINTIDADDPTLAVSEPVPFSITD